MIVQIALALLKYMMLPLLALYNFKAKKELPNISRAN